MTPDLEFELVRAALKDPHRAQNWVREKSNLPYQPMTYSPSLPEAEAPWEHMAAKFPGGPKLIR